MESTRIAAHLKVSQAHHYWPEMTPELKRAVLSDWTRQLEDVPAPFAAEAFHYVLGRLSRRPSPGDVRNRALRKLHEARERLRLERGPEPIKREGPDLTPEERRAIAERAAAEFPMLGAPKRKRGFLGPVAT